MAPSFYNNFWSTIPSWRSPLGRTNWEDEVIPYGPYLADDVDLGGPEIIYQSSQINIMIHGMIKTYLILFILFIIFPLILLKCVIKIMR